MRNFQIFFITLFLLLAINIKPARADILGLSFAGLGGYSSINTSNEFGMGAGTLGFGLRASMEFFSTLVANIEWTYMNTTPSGTTTGFTSNFTIASLSADYILLPVPTKFNLFLGPKIGQGTTSAGGSSGSSMAFGGELGFDYFTSSSLSLGVEINYLSVAAPTLNSVAGNTGSLIQVLAALKYWL